MPKENKKYFKLIYPDKSVEYFNCDSREFFEEKKRLQKVWEEKDKVDDVWQSFEISEKNFEKLQNELKNPFDIFEKLERGEYVN
nr:hypothetical protein [uncultured Mediterranean phage uvMED]